jgi:hypothetical protein
MSIPLSKFVQAFSAMHMPSIAQKLLSAAARRRELFPGGPPAVVGEDRGSWNGYRDADGPHHELGHKEGMPFDSLVHRSRLPALTRQR